MLEQSEAVEVLAYYAARRQACVADQRTSNTCAGKLGEAFSRTLDRQDLAAM